MLSGWQADGSDVVRVANRSLHLHQGDVVVVSVLVVVWMRYDSLQIPFHHAVAIVALSVEAEVGFPRAGLRVPGDVQKPDSSSVQSQCCINLKQHWHLQHLQHLKQ